MIKNLKNIFKERKAISLIALVITIVVLLILVGITIYISLRNNGIIGKAITASNEIKKQSASEEISFKIISFQISSYSRKQELPTLQEFANLLCEDEEIAYVKVTSSSASLEAINVVGYDSIYTKLKEYPYEFEINSSLQLASIDGIEFASTEGSSSITQQQYEQLLSRLTTLEDQFSSIKNESVEYSTEEKLIGKWIDNKPLYQKTLQYDITTSGSVVELFNLNTLNIDNVIECKGFIKQANNHEAFIGSRYDAEAYYFLPYYVYTTKKMHARVSSTYIGFTSYITIQYTKL